MVCFLAVPVIRVDVGDDVLGAELGVGWTNPVKI